MAVVTSSLVLMLQALVTLVAAQNPGKCTLNFYGSSMGIAGYVSVCV
jgi:hypothetical protein